MRRHLRLARYCVHSCNQRTRTSSYALQCYQPDTNLIDLKQVQISSFYSEFWKHNSYVNANEILVFFQRVLNNFILQKCLFSYFLLKILNPQHYRILIFSRYIITPFCIVGIVLGNMQGCLHNPLGMLRRWCWHILPPGYNPGYSFTQSTTHIDLTVLPEIGPGILA